MDEDKVVYLILLILIGIGFVIKKKLKIHVLQDIGKKISKTYHSVPLWIRYLILISIPIIYLVVYEYYYLQ